MSAATLKLRTPVTEIIQQRFSCRTYVERPIAQRKRERLAAWLTPQEGPLGGRARFALLATTEADRQALRGLGTYGFIKGATGFIAGAIRRSEDCLEDFGYLMERIVLFSTDLGLGTCWLGGTFTRSLFAERIRLRDDEAMPAVVSVGYIAQDPRAFDRLARRFVRADKRLPWERMFYDGEFGAPISRDGAGAYAAPLDMVRLGPSASNKQPWRIVRALNAWHFYLQRTRRYGRGRDLSGGSDLQRIDLGIAMSHFELTANELNLAGGWQVREPALARPDDTGYVATWVEGARST